MATYKAEDLIAKFREYHAYKSKVMQEWRLTRSLYKGEFWEVFKSYLKDYTLTPDWNYFEYVVQAYLNSVYSGSFIGTITAVNTDNEKAVEKLNAFVAYNWNKWGMKNKFLHIGENGELYNLGGIRCDWVNDKLKLQTILPQEIYLDPNVTDYRDGEMLFLERAVNINTLKRNKNFASAVEKYTKENKTFNDKTLQNRLASGENRQTNNNKTVSLIECFIRNDKGGLDQVFILDEVVIIYENMDIPLERFPVVCYSPQLPDGGPYGSSKLTKIINSVIVLNLLDSMEATQPYRLLNRVRFVNVDGRLNMRAFADYGNTPGASFQVKGDPKGIIHYEDVPTIPDLSNIKQRLENSIFQVTGVDPYYKGRMTNSVQTTGGVDKMQARVTMLTDNSRITMLDQFCEELTRVALEFHFVYGGALEYKIPRRSATGTNRVIGVDKLRFNELTQSDFDYMITSSTLLPMNQSNLYESVKQLYEMQGQYQFKIPVVTPQDLIRYSDFPQKDLFLQRMEREERAQTGTDLVADLTNFANIFSRLLSSGISEEEAAQEAINILIEEKNAMKQDPTIGQGFQ